MSNRWLGRPKVGGWIYDQAVVSRYIKWLLLEWVTWTTKYHKPAWYKIIQPRQLNLPIPLG